MAVRIRLKRLGRTHRPFYRICAMDGRSPRDGRVIEELGHYDPMVRETDARAVLEAERIDYWLGVGAQPSDKVKVLIKKYGSNGTHLEQQKAALERLSDPQDRSAADTDRASQSAPAADGAAEAETATAAAEQPAPETPRRGTPGRARRRGRFEVTERCDLMS